MDGTGWQVEHQCPQCGAAVNLQEAQRFFSCRFCRVKLVMVPGRTFQYVLPAAPGPETIVYAPYQRFKGMFFSYAAGEVRSGLIDISRNVSRLPLLPPSLGLRPETLKLKFLSPETKGLFLPPLDEEATTPPAGSRTSECVYIGETTSLIHAPFFIRDGGLWDAVLRQKIAPVSDKDAATFLSATENGINQISFLPALCPDCGWDLEGAPLSVVFCCRNCDSAWHDAGSGFERIQTSHLAAKDSKACYLPFWRIEAEMEGYVRSHADAARLLNLPLVIPERWEDEPFSWLIPAFKIQPEAYLRISKVMSLTPCDTAPSDMLPRTGDLHPVTLPLSEAFEGLKIAFVASAVAKSEVMKRYGRLHPVLKSAILLFYPFQRCGLELIRPDHPLSISAGALKWGMYG